LKPTKPRSESRGHQGDALLPLVPDDPGAAVHLNHGGPWPPDVRRRVIDVEAEASPTGLAVDDVPLDAGRREAQGEGHQEPQPGDGAEPLDPEGLLERAAHRLHRPLTLDDQVEEAQPGEGHEADGDAPGPALQPAEGDEHGERPSLPEQVVGGELGREHGEEEARDHEPLRAPDGHERVEGEQRAAARHEKEQPGEEVGHPPLPVYLRPGETPASGGGSVGGRPPAGPPSPAHVVVEPLPRDGAVPHQTPGSRR
jgi:hypothetical protein